MIIDARNFVGTEYGRQGSMRAVINHALDGIETGGHIHIEAMKDVAGKIVPWARLSMHIHKLKGEREFKLRKSLHESGYEIHRIA